MYTYCVYIYVYKLKLNVNMLFLRHAELTAHQDEKDESS